MRQRRRRSYPAHRPAAVMVRPYVLTMLAIVAMVASACADPVTEPAVAPPATAQPDTIDPEHSDPAEGEPEQGEPAEGGPPQDETDQDEADQDDAPRADPENRMPDDHLAGPGVCVTEVEREVLGTISAQLDDLARRDFDAALSQATSAFQAGTDAAAFRALIEGSFPLLLQDASAELSGCFRSGPATVEASVEVTTGDRVSAPFVYRLRLDDGRWAIDAAARLTPPPATA